jgi:hypothetical protein
MLIFLLLLLIFPIDAKLSIREVAEQYVALLEKKEIQIN